MVRRNRMVIRNDSSDDEGTIPMEVEEEDEEIPCSSTSGSKSSRSKSNSKSKSKNSELEIEESADLSDPVIAGLRYAMDSSLALVKDILPTCFTDEKKENVVERLKTTMLHLIRSEVNYVEGLKVIDQTSNEICESSEDESNDERVDDTFILSECERLKTMSLEKITEHRRALKPEVLMKHLYYKKLLQQIEETQNEIEKRNKAEEENSEDESEGIEEPSFADLESEEQAEEMIPTTDPITKLPLTDPIRNKYCKHIYGKASILEIISTGKNMRCLTIGCANKRWVKESHLVEDPHLIEKVKRRLKTKESQQQRNRGRQATHRIEDS